MFGSTLQSNAMSDGGAEPRVEVSVGFTAYFLALGVTTPHYTELDLVAIGKKRSVNSAFRKVRPENTALRNQVLNGARESMRATCRWGSLCVYSFSNRSGTSRARRFRPRASHALKRYLHEAQTSRHRG